MVVIYFVNNIFKGIGNKIVIEWLNCIYFLFLFDYYDAFIVFSTELCTTIFKF